jgi:hypothetical protein
LFFEIFGADLRSGDVLVVASRARKAEGKQGGLA